MNGSEENDRLKYLYKEYHRNMNDMKKYLTPIKLKPKVEDSFNVYKAYKERLSPREADCKIK